MTHRRCIAGLAILACSLPSAAALADDAGAPGFQAYLPAPLNGDWVRGPSVTIEADPLLFGGGRSSRAAYVTPGEACLITVTGGAPMMQGFSMNFSNPAAAGLTGARVTHVGDESVVVLADGEVQALAGNYLVQYQGSCALQTKLAYVANTDLAALRALPPAPVTVAARAAVANGSSALAWDRTFGGPAKDWAYALTATADGGLCAAGRTASKGAGLEDGWLVRVDGDGELLWDQTYGGEATDRFRGIIETRDGGLAVTGASESGAAGEFDLWVLRLDAGGRVIWERRFGGTGTDWGSALVETGDGGFVIAGYTQDAPDRDYDIWILKLDSEGSLLWEQRFGGAATDWANAIAETSTGDLVVAGHTESMGAGDADIYVLKLASDGTLRWERTYGGAARDYGSSVSIARDGSPIVIAQTESVGAGRVDAQILKLDGAGDVTWQRAYGGPQDDWARSALQTRDGGYAVAGYTLSRGAGLYDAWLLRLAADGTLVSEATFGGEANEWARALVELPDGSLAMAGDNWSKGAGLGDVWILKLAPD